MKLKNLTPFSRFFWLWHSRKLIDRDQSWLQFNERVLAQAFDETNSKLERLKFLAISATNLNEFFMIRMPSVERLRGVRSNIFSSLRRFRRLQDKALHKLIAEYRAEGIDLRLGARDAQAKQVFEEEVFPKLPPVELFTPRRLSALDNLDLAVVLSRELWIRVPRRHVGIIRRGSQFYLWEDLLVQFMPEKCGIKKPALALRVIRDADVTLEDDDDPSSLPETVRRKIQDRDRGRPMRLEWRGPSLPRAIRKVARGLGLRPDQVVGMRPPLSLDSLWGLVRELSDEKTIVPVHIPQPFAQGDLFSRIAKRDYLLHHPYDPFDAFLDFLKAAAEDPRVERIEQTLYRTDYSSPVVEVLKAAAKRKRVDVVIELRARFDEANNLRITEELRMAGVNVSFGVPGLKTHAKVALVSRREGDALRSYVHLSTGNYHAVTARLYTDLSLLTCNGEIGEDARRLFDALYAGQIPHGFKQLVIAPTRLSRRLLSLIEAESAAARVGKPARIFAKVNALVDPKIISALYNASRAGVEIDLVVRGAVSLIPGVPGLSDRIRVRSIVDRFLEHSRIYYFENGGRLYLSSADWMPRNFFSRLEIAFPVLDPRLYNYLCDTVFSIYLADNVRAWGLNAKGHWSRFQPDPKDQRRRAQEDFIRLAEQKYVGTGLG